MAVPCYYFAAWEHLLLPVATSYVPDVLLLSVGFHVDVVTCHWRANSAQAP